MKKHELIFGAMRLPIEFVLVIISFFIAREIRLVTDLIPSVQLQIQTISTMSLLGFSLVGALVCIILFGIHGLYKISIAQSKIRELLLVVRYMLYWFFLYIGMLYLAN